MENKRYCTALAPVRSGVHVQERRSVLPRNYRTIAVTDSIYGVIIKLYRRRLQRLVDRVGSPEQYVSRPLY